MTTLKNKLTPSRFSGMSPFKAVVVGYVLGESFTTPEIAKIKVSEAENLVYVRQACGISFDGIQSLEDLRQLEPTSRCGGADGGGAAGGGEVVHCQG